VSEMESQSLRVPPSVLTFVAGIASWHPPNEILYHGLSSIIYDS